MKFPSPLYTIVFVALLFGVDLFAYFLFVYTPNIASIQYYTYIQNLLNEKGIPVSKVDWKIICLTVAAFHAIGFIVYTLFEKRLPLGTIPRRLSPTITLLIIIALFVIIASTNLTNIVKFMYTFVDAFIISPIRDMFTKFVPAIFASFAMYILITPNLLRFLEGRRVPLPQGIAITFVVVSLISIISLEATTDAIDILQKQGALDVKLFTLGVGILGLVAFFEIVQFAKEMKIHEATQLPALFHIALWGLTIMKNIEGIPTGVISTFATYLLFATAVIIYVSGLFIMFGLIMRKTNYILIGQATSVAMTMAIAPSLDKLSKTLEETSGSIGGVGAGPYPELLGLLTLIVSLIYIVKKLRS